MLPGTAYVMLDQSDIQQFGKILDERLDKKLKENNKNLVSKDDLRENNKNLVTKNDLKAALEENNKKLVSKNDLAENNKNLVTKDDLRENNKILLEQVAIEVGKVIEENITPALDDHFKEVDHKLGRLNNGLRDFMDKKFNDMKGDIIAVVQGDRERDTLFKGKMVEIVRRNKLADEPEITQLAALIR